MAALVEDRPTSVIRHPELRRPLRDLVSRRSNSSTNDSQDPVAAAIALSCTGAQLDQLVAGLRKAGSLDDVNARHEARSVSWSWAEDGSMILRGRFSPEEGSYPHRVRRQEYADAMVVLAETTLATGPAPAPGGARLQVNIHTDLDALLGREAASRSRARIEDGPELHPKTADRLCCDSGAVIVAHHQKNPSSRRRGTWMDVGRRTRVVPAALRRALVLRDHGCRFPGCTQVLFVDAHHVIYWSRGGFTFYRPDGVPIPDAPSVPSPRPHMPPLSDVTVTPTTATPTWNGERLDLEYAIAVLTQRPSLN